MLLQVTERVYAIRAMFGVSPFSVWAYAVTDPFSSRVLLVDSGGLGGGKAIAHALPAIGRSTADVVAIAITHWHADHTGGIAELLGGTDHPVAIYGGAADLETYRAQRALSIKVRPFLFVPPGLRFPHRPGRLPDHEGISYVHLTPENAGTALSEWGIEAVPSPGHTAGHTAYHLVSGGAMFCGDAILRLGRHLYTLGFHHDVGQMDASAQRLLREAFDWLLPAHVAPVSFPVPLSARQNVGGEPEGMVLLLERLTAWKYHGTIRPVSYCAT